MSKLNATIAHGILSACGIAPGTHPDLIRKESADRAQEFCDRYRFKPHRLKPGEDTLSAFLAHLNRLTTADADKPGKDPTPRFELRDRMLIMNGVAVAKLSRVSTDGEVYTTNPAEFDALTRRIRDAMNMAAFIDPLNFARPEAGDEAAPVSEAAE